MFWLLGTHRLLGSGECRGYLFNNTTTKWRRYSRILLTLLLVLVLDGDHNVVLCEFGGYEPDDSTMAIVNLTYYDPETGGLHTEKAEIGKFGTGRIDAVSGLVVHVKNRNSKTNVSSNNGCEYPFESKPPANNEPWVALIKRGGCHFQVKIANAQKSSASGVVVYNNDSDDPTLKKMNFQVPNMVAVFITQEKGEEIATLVDNDTKVKIYVTVGSYHPPRPNINRTSVLFVSISFIVLMIISLAWLVFYYVQRFRYIHAKDRLARRLFSAAKKAVAKIPVKNIKAGDKEADGDNECCAVCIEPYKPSDVVRTLPCKHMFHKTCVDPWLLEHRTCPMCKMDILRFYGLAWGSQESILQIDVEDPALSSSGDPDSEHYATGSMHRSTPRDSPSTEQHATSSGMMERVETYNVESEGSLRSRLSSTKSCNPSNAPSPSESLGSTSGLTPPVMSTSDHMDSCAGSSNSVTVTCPLHGCSGRVT